MKRCFRCGKEKAYRHFNRSMKNRDGLHSYCRECQKEHYQANLARHLENARRNSAARRSEARRIMAEALADGCIDCGIRDLRVLEFDHVRGTKVAAVTVLARRGAGTASLLDEIAKCEVRCRNCHAIATLTRLGKSWRLP
ncbi:MAG TPA: hypothetical protein VN200_05210 [Rhodoglobus sp.]|nr:hypothetical protein [Rhodoglobus sp.]